MDIEVVGSGANEVRPRRGTSSIWDAVAKRRRACRLAFMVTWALAGGAVAEDHEPVLGLDEQSDQDREALVALYHATAGPGWRRQEGWLTAPSMSGWEGVTVADGRVTELRLKNNRLSGSLPQELGNLRRLRRLELPGNNLVGSIPDALGHLSMLFHLDLRWNSLEGRIPAALAKLPNIGELLLSANRLTGTIPSAFSEASMVRRLDLSHNALSGEIPSELGSLRFLRALALQNNQLHGPIPPELGKLSNLQRLYLQGNELTGRIPPDLSELAKLTYVNLSGNRLGGQIPAQLGSLGDLVWLGLGRNRLSGEIPRELGNLLKLKHLDLRSGHAETPNNNGPTADAFFTGAIPEAFGSLTELEFLDLAGNSLSGSIPAGIGSHGPGTRITSDEEQCESADRSADGPTTEYECGADTTVPGLSGRDAWAATTSDIPDDAFHRMAMEAVAAITVVSGYAVVDHERVPDWLSLEDAAMQVELINAHLRDAGFVIRSAQDLVRAIETYEGPTLELTVPGTPNPHHADGRSEPHSRDPHDQRIQGPGRGSLLVPSASPSNTESRATPDEDEDEDRPPRETVGLVYCNSD